MVKRATRDQRVNLRTYKTSIPENNARPALFREEE